MAAAISFRVRRRAGGCRGLFVGDGFGEASEAALALLVVGDGFEEVDAAEVGPEAVGDEDLGVGDLPEEEVGDALLAGGADDEVGVGHVRGVEGAGDVGLVEGVEGAGAEEVFDGAAAGVGFGGEVGEDACGRRRRSRSGRRS